MRSRVSLRRWVRQLLPHASASTQSAGAQLLRALLVGYTTNLAQLARQLDRPGSAKGARQWLSRVLARPQFAPASLYAALLRTLPTLCPTGGTEGTRSSPVPLLVDLTFFGHQWVVLQVSLPWEGRALPLFRVTQPYQGEERSQATAVHAALQWLERHLPGPQAHYVLVLDRGFPSHRLLRHLQAQGWRFVIRVEGKWRVEHPEYTGALTGLGVAGRVSAVPQVLVGAGLGEGGRGPTRSSQAQVVYYRGVGHAAPWYLVTSETDPRLAVQLYRQRMQIEQEFRDLKGFWGLDHLAEWHDQERVASFLAWLAVYEWRLAHLWETHALQQVQAQLRVGGKLSWIRTVREWLTQQLRLLKPIPDLRL